jgi:hypothetical protein
MFSIISTNYIVYPGENVAISIDTNNEINFKIKGNEQ